MLLLLKNTLLLMIKGKGLHTLCDRSHLMKIGKLEIRVLPPGGAQIFRINHHGSSSQESRGMFSAKQDGLNTSNIKIISLNVCKSTTVRGGLFGIL